MEPAPLVRPRSYVVRGRKTDAQQRAIAEFWPAFGVDFAGGLLDLDALFGRTAPRTVEIGFGNGENLLALAERHPERDFLGVEVHGAGVGRVFAAMRERGLSNIRVIRHDAVEVFETGLSAGSVAEALLFFPDPWPKARHHRRRLVQPDVVRLLARALAADGVLRLATDWEPYADHMLAVLDAEPVLVNVAGPGAFIPRPEARPVTKFERRGEKLGHSIFDLEYRPLP
ncbi:tRNA (guanine-N7)-methyltransferase [Leifsonia xyli subsp. xyli]|uniref:tRNA (guanine-N(7)-)-methyltransferase n=2 Tax=Leifsonia xyli subsp. xyli TaxID=59736 RepID=TRMB_LEIXX|nr:tRNA (guanosine(46)-N7)-methyltransferase TrmB [Leifsonia xyli]Q6AFR0.1 RecName: Full=tRNA (guanine-N(7)-)-methyltransferase; AltName: Full=tRNA (guanine(46)-N(7))-methyltransferase; AltName: Full=tRNA(m7G46)-methyltransferase [Leifsonia xyli subsp. xyli str. CTCB07]AAT88785.1 DNA mismatch repair protein [Leifsonia xyli subsp. xyli str. CTCB07]ODA89504.1 tRNA (guanine-N7)-methyltransferase [Leifsonia xyli subsp. xyli]